MCSLTNGNVKSETQELKEKSKSTDSTQYFEEHAALLSPVLHTLSIGSAPQILIYHRLSEVGQDVPVLDKNKVSQPRPQFSLEVRRITFTSGLDIVE